MHEHSDLRRMLIVLILFWKSVYDFEETKNRVLTDGDKEPSRAGQVLCFFKPYTIFKKPHLRSLQFVAKREEISFAQPECVLAIISAVEDY